MSSNEFYQKLYHGFHSGLNWDTPAKWDPEHKKAFYKKYPQVFDDDYLHLPPDQQDPEEVDRILKRFSEVARVTKLYFPARLTLVDHEGDGTDKKFLVHGGRLSTHGDVRLNKRESFLMYRKQQGRGIQEGWLREDGSLSPYYRDPAQDDSEQSDEGEEKPDEVDSEDEDEELYLQARNPEEDTAISGVMSKLDVEGS
ncbi:hypothetical protein PG996_006878 [Apiospora saccharicola]|uniref:Uncharacterized protein n=1 Tax=Apiospora saccharicola TaxID=335842 RepID=A0ABR1V987_9PEZI